MSGGRIGPRVQERGGRDRSWYVLVIVAFVLGLAFASAPDAEDYGADGASVASGQLAVPPPPESLAAPGDARPVSYWSWLRVRDQRDELLAIVRCVRQQMPGARASRIWGDCGIWDYEPPRPEGP